MQIETAIRLASTRVDDCSVVDATRIIRAFLDELTSCGICGGTREVTYSRTTPVTVRNGEPRQDFIEAGTKVGCPRCGGATDSATLNRDPDHVTWHCTASDCREPQQAHGTHEKCGYRILLPLDIDTLLEQVAGRHPEGVASHSGPSAPRR